MKLRKRLGVAVATAALLTGGLAMLSSPANAATVNNNYECAPATGWCFQTNPPYNPNFRRDCRWNSRYNFTGGMWYTGCQYWKPAV